MNDPFENFKQNQSQNKEDDPIRGFPDLNTKLVPWVEDRVKSNLGKDLEKGTDIFKQAINLIKSALIVIGTLIMVPALLRLMYEFSAWAFDQAGKVFP